MKMRVADVVVRRLADAGVRDVFLVTGGGAMHLNDALGREPRLRYICNHHEQASAIAAEGYARVRGTVGVVMVTSGPGGINALNGVYGAFTDSIPMLVLSGQVKRETRLAAHGLNGRLRQFGDQEADIIRMVEGITKYAAVVLEPDDIRYHVERALHMAVSGRPGPCWLDIPVDVQGAMVESDRLRAYDPGEDPISFAPGDLDLVCDRLVERLARAERPVLMAGTGVRLSGGVEVFRRLVGKLGMPVVTAWTHDLIATSDPQFCGRPGSIGDRAGNFVVQNSDCLLVVGSRLNIRQVSYNWNNFARHAYKIQVDVDRAELDKPMVRADERIQSDARVFLEALERAFERKPWHPGRHAQWLAWGRERRRLHPVFQPERQTTHSEGINPYHFMKEVFPLLNGDDIVVCGNATACIVTFQSADLKPDQRLFSNSGSASMGYDLPAAIGAVVAGEGRRVICMAGDGSLQMNIQELQTWALHRWPIKLFVLNNGGYLSIRQTQTNFFGLAVGAGAESGVTCPDFVALARAYGLPAVRISGPGFVAGLRGFLEEPGPGVCEVVLDAGQGFEPKLSSRRLPDGRMVSAPLEDMAPFLDRDVLRQNMIVPLMPDP